MSRRRKRHVHELPARDRVRAALSELVGSAGEVDVDQQSYDWRPDDLLVWVRFNQPITGTVLSLFRLRVAERMHGLLPRGQLFDDWIVVLRCAGETIGQIAWHDTLEELRGDGSQI